MMKSIFVLGGLTSGLLLSLSLAGCGGASSEDEASSGEDALLSPADPIAFCRASGLRVIIGTSNNDLLNGTPGADCIVALGGQDTINAGGGDDIVFAGDGDDIVLGGPGNDRLFGGSGQDNLQGGSGNDTLSGEQGDDQLHGNDGDDTLSGGQGQDRLFGDAGNDSLNGDVGDDQLQGGDGNDVLSDCLNHNTLNGNAGKNSCQASTKGDSSSSLISCQTVTACPSNDNGPPPWPPDPGEQACEWGVSGQNLSNTWSQPEESSIDPANARYLTTKWTFTTGGDVSTTPSVCGETVYFPDWAGNLFAVDRRTGRQIWSHKISEYNGVTGSISRVSPVVDHDQLILGDLQSPSVAHQGANMMAVDRATGALRWIRQVESHPAAIITGSPVVYKGVVYVGVSSIEEGLAANAAYPCCTFRGSIVALNAKTGAILWQTYDMPDNHGQRKQYSGGAVWQRPAIDPERGTLFIGTGNNYSVPPDVEACENTTPNANCTGSDDLFDAALALDLRTGRIKWARKVKTFDTWTLACLDASGVNPNCPVPNSDDYDFSGAGPNLVGNIVGFGQKSGIYWAFDPKDGRIVWSTPVGPGATLGGIEWGTATDGKRIYVAIANAGKRPYTLVPSGQQITWGAWSALDAKTGRILWQTADPVAGSIDRASVSVANGVMYAGSNSGNMYALDARTGAILWNFASGGTVLDGPSIVDGTLYWGSGYASVNGTANNKVYAFSVRDFFHPWRPWGGEK